MLARNGIAAHELTETVDDFLRHMANQRRAAPNTVSAYHNDLTQFHDYLVSSEPPGSNSQGHVGLDDVDPGTVAGFVLFLRTRGYSQATIARKVAAVKSFFRYAAEAGLVVRNPALELDSPQAKPVVGQFDHRGHECVTNAAILKVVVD